MAPRLRAPQVIAQQHANETVHVSAQFGDGAQIFTKVQPPTAPDGRFVKDRFTIDLDASTVACPNAVTVAIRPAKAGGGTAVFGAVRHPLCWQARRRVEEL